MLRLLQVQMQMPKPLQALPPPQVPLPRQVPPRPQMQLLMPCCLPLVYLCGTWRTCITEYRRTNCASKEAMFAVGSICENTETVTTEVVAMAAPV